MAKAIENKLPICNDTRDCGMSTLKFGPRKCMCLDITYKKDGECPFCKPDKAYTNGKWYPYVSYSGKGSSAAS